MKKWFKRILKVIAIVLLILVISLVIFIRSSKLKPPFVADTPLKERKEVDNNHYVLGNNWLRLNRPGMWEMYLEGDAYERGLSYGILAKELVIKQEEYFVESIKEMIPSKKMLNFLKYMIAIFNRNIDKNIPEEYLQEIYGVSKSASEEFNFIGSNYERLVNYHAAHDIGHALADYMIVGCSSFSVWGEQSEDSSLLIGRNFDFYVGDDFAKEKIICFMKPDEGIPFAMITWGGMIGAVSGCNQEGLTVTLNAAKSDMPRSAATPISILAREILQYASTIDEAFEIANKRKTFVAESLLIGSAKNGRTAIIEKSPTKISMYEENDDDLICTNHYQSDAFSNDKNNLEFKTTSSTDYRFKRTEELLKQYEPLDYLEAATILRDRNGLDNETLGMGNDFALNQLIAHHSIIFKPEENLFWISSYPYQLGAYLAYDLDDVFNEDETFNKPINQTELEIPTDSFLYSEDFNKYQNYLGFKNKIESSGKKEFDQTLPLVDEMINANPDNFLVYKVAGDFYLKHKQQDKALAMYKLALEKNGISELDKNSILKKLNK